MKHTAHQYDILKKYLGILFPLQQSVSHRNQDATWLPLRTPFSGLAVIFQKAGEQKLLCA